MNADLLLAHYDRISDAPDAVARLRKFILDLAVRGKLVEQNSDDESAEKLLLRITKNRSKAIGHGSELAIRFTPSEPEPFNLPSNWTWARLGSICSKTGSGSTPRGGKSVYQQHGVPFLRSQNVYNDGLRLDDVAFIADETHEHMSGTAVEPGDLLLNITGGSIGRCCLVPQNMGQANISQHVAIIRVALDGIQYYLHKMVLSPYFQSFVLSEQTGAGRLGLPKNKMDLIPVALPPLPEQHRIVAKVDELMALCDGLEASQREQEAHRDRLSASAHHHLNNGDDAEELRTHAQFFTSHLPRLTRRPEQIKQLRQTILNLAFNCQLTSTTEPASAPILLKDVATLQNGYAFKSEWFVRQGIRLLRNANVSHGEICWDDVVCLPEKMAGEFQRFRLEVGDIVLSLDRPFIVTGTKVARIRVQDLPCLLLQRVGRFQIRPTRISKDYLFLWLHSPQFTGQIDPGRSNGVPHISSKQVEATEILVPSLAEQHRIVAKVDELMALCDKLEASLSTAQTETSRLLESVLHHALEASA
jgi:type I restriction enzyme S subunit